MPEQLIEIAEAGSGPDALEALDGLLGESRARVDSLTQRRIRDDLRRQIASLEKRLGALFASAFPRKGFDWSVGAVGGPRVLDVGELERVRDALAARLRDAQAELGRRGEIEEANRGLLESMIAEPERYHWVRVSGEDIGERGCRHWHSRPRWGILGMLMGWWRVKVSSGCPLAAGLAAPANRRISASTLDPLAHVRPEYARFADLPASPVLLVFRGRWPRSVRSVDQERAPLRRSRRRPRRRAGERRPATSAHRPHGVRSRSSSW